MEIDIKPQIEEAVGLESAQLVMSQLEALYVFRTANGKNYSTIMTPLDLSRLVPDKKVSEQIKSWEGGIIRRLEIANKAVETGLHPTYKDNVKDDEGNVIGTTPRPLSKTGKETFKRKAKDLESQLGKITLVKLV